MKKYLTLAVIPLAFGLAGCGHAAPASTVDKPQKKENVIENHFLGELEHPNGWPGMHYGKDHGWGGLSCDWVDYHSRVDHR